MSVTKKYSIYQININAAEAREINSMRDPRSDHPKYKAYTLTMDGKFNEGFGFYEKVAEIEATDLGQVFQIGNIGPEKAITRLDCMHSLSVGDVIVDGEDCQWGIINVGFAKLENIIL